jgi:hypothetical protein
MTPSFSAANLPYLETLETSTWATINPNSLHVNHRSNANQLDVLVLLQDIREDVGDQIHTLLIAPSTNKYEKLGSRVDFKTSPFLSFSPQVAS